MKSPCFFRTALRACTVFAVVLLLACSRDARAEQPVWGKQPCAHCAMLLSAPRYAAQLVSDAGERFFFDDIGCMVLWVAEHAARPTELWVYDLQVKQWVTARNARYAAGARTPMNFGYEVSHEATSVGFETVYERVVAMNKGAR